MVKHNGRMLTDQTCKLKAEEILDVVKMWGIGKVDAYYICRHMKWLCQNTHTWVNPLDGTGLKIADVDNLAREAAGLPAVPVVTPEEANLRNEILSKNKSH